MWAAKKWWRGLFMPVSNLCPQMFALIFASIVCLKFLPPLASTRFAFPLVPNKFFHFQKSKLQHPKSSPTNSAQPCPTVLNRAQPCPTVKPDHVDVHFRHFAIFERDRGLGTFVEQTLLSGRRRIERIQRFPNLCQTPKPTKIGKHQFCVGFGQFGPTT